MPHASCQTILKLTSWVCGTHPSTLQRASARAGDPKETGTETSLILSRLVLVRSNMSSIAADHSLDSFLGLEIWASGDRVCCLRFRVPGLGFRAWGLWVGGQGLGVGC